MKHLFACALAGVLCLAAASAHAQTETESSSERRSDKWQFSIMSGVAIARDDTGTSGSSGVMGGAGFETIWPIASSNFDWGWGSDLAYTNTAFLVTRGHRFVGSSSFGVSIPIYETLVYNFKASLNNRFYWNAPTYVVPARLFALVGYQARIVTISGDYRNGTVALHGYQVGFGVDIGITPDFPEFKLRSEYAFAQNFGATGLGISSHDLNFGVVYELW